MMKPEDFFLPDPKEIPVEVSHQQSPALPVTDSSGARLLLLPVNGKAQYSEREGEEYELLTVVDAAKLLNVSEDWIYRGPADFRSREDCHERH